MKGIQNVFKFPLFLFPWQLRQSLIFKMAAVDIEMAKMQTN
jgi:hypothetical protein